MISARSAGAFALLTAILASSSAAPADDSAEITLQRTLDQPFNLTLTKVPLSEAFTQIAATAKISLQVDPACYDLLPYGATTVVSADFRQSKLRDAIEQVLLNLGLQQTVSGSAVIIRPSGPLARIGRRASWDELKLLQDLRNSDIKPAADGSLDWKSAIRSALDRPDLLVTIADEGLASALRDKSLDQIKKQLPLSAFRALDAYCQLTNQVWFVEAGPGTSGMTSAGAGGTVRIMSPKAWMLRQMERPIQVDFTNAPLPQVVDELTYRSGIRFVPEPGLYQAVPVISLKSNNSSVLQTLETLAGGTRIAFDVRDDSILLHMAGNEPAPPAAAKSDTIVARIPVPVGSGPDKSVMDVYIRESDLPPELNELRKKKIQDAVEALQKSWTPETRPATPTAPAPK